MSYKTTYKCGDYTMIFRPGSKATIYKKDKLRFQGSKKIAVQMFCNETGSPDARRDFQTLLDAARKAMEFRNHASKKDDLTEKRK